MRRAAIFIAALTAAFAVAPVAASANVRRVAYAADGRLSEWHGTPTFLAGRTRSRTAELTDADPHELRLTRKY